MYFLKTVMMGKKGMPIKAFLKNIINLNFKEGKVMVAKGVMLFQKGESIEFKMIRRHWIAHII